MSSNETKIEGRAAVSAYLVLGAPFFLLAMGCAIVAWKHPERNAQTGAAICFLAGVLWAAWVRGFRIRITADQIEYRDGFYRSVTVPLNTIREVKNTWIEWKTFGRHLQIPRLVIVYGNDRRLAAINTKPFKRRDLRTVNDVLQKSLPNPDSRP
jgi:hypothetical protein